MKSRKYSLHWFSTSLAALAWVLAGCGEADEGADSAHLCPAEPPTEGDRCRDELVCQYQPACIGDAHAVVATCENGRFELRYSACVIRDSRDAGVDAAAIGLDAGDAAARDASVPDAEARVVDAAGIDSGR